MSKAKSILKNFIDQMIPVMIGVYLGFALNNFGESKKIKKDTDDVFNMIKVEIQENLSSVQKVEKYHEDLGKDILAILQSTNVRQKFNEYSFKGLRPGRVYRSSYDTAIQSGTIKNFDIQNIKVFNRLYSLQDSYDDYNKTFLGNFLGCDFPNTDKEVKNLLISLNMSLNDVIISEDELIKAYNDVLKEF